MMVEQVHVIKLHSHSDIVTKLTRRADPICIQDIVPPDGLSCGSVQHGTHHLVKGLIGVAAKDTFGIFIDEAPTKS